MINPVARRCYRNLGNSLLLEEIPKEAVRILDVGCGGGDNARRLIGRGHVVDGITLSPSEARQAKKSCRRVWVHNLDYGLPKNLSPVYDAAICSHVLEHLREPEQLVGQLSRLLRPTRGSLHVALPNPFFYRNRWQLLRGNCRYEPSGLMDSTHLRWFTFESGRELLEAGGFRLLSAKVEGSLPLAPLRRILPRSWVAGLDRWGCRAWPGLFGYQMIYSARPTKR